MPPVFNAMARRRRTRDAKAGRLLRPVRFLLALVGAALMAALLVLNIRAKGFTSDLYSLAGDRGNLLGALSRKTTGQIRVLCDDEALADACRAVFPFRPAPDLDQLLAYYKTHARGLLCARTRERLEKGEFDKIRRSVTRRDYTGVGLFPKADDPDYFLSDYVAGLKDLMPKGLQGSQVLLTGEVEGHEAALPRLIALAEEYGGIRLSGAPFHAFLATEKSKREINLLGVLSCAAVLLLGLALFRSLRFVVPTVLTLAFGFLAGATAVFACFEKPHVLTFLFGTSLIGLGVDYCYHALWTGPGEALRRKLAAAFATTVLAFSPLLVSSVAVLNQMAVFTLAGLAAILALVLTGSSAAQTSRAAAVSGLGAGLPVRVHLARLALFGLAAAGCCRLVFSNAPELFYAPPRLLADGEAKVAAIVGATGRFAITSGATLEEALANEEAAGLDGVSRLLPSLARQQRDEELIQSFSSRPRTGEYVTRENLPEALRVLADAMIVPLGDRTVLIAPLPPGHEGTAVAQLNPRAELTAMFETFNRETRLLLAVSFAVMALALLVLFRRRALAYAAPGFAAVVATAGVLGWLGEKITFFHALSFFVMTGLGIDYAIFHKASGSSDGGTRKVVLFSFLTSLVGFGALGLTSFPPTRAMGLTLALGLLFAYFFSLPRAPDGACGAARLARTARAVGRQRPHPDHLVHLPLFGQDGRETRFRRPVSFHLPVLPRRAGGALRVLWRAGAPARFRARLPADARFRVDDDRQDGRVHALQESAGVHALGRHGLDARRRLSYLVAPRLHRGSARAGRATGGAPRERAACPRLSADGTRCGLYVSLREPAAPRRHLYAPCGRGYRRRDGGRDAGRDTARRACPDGGRPLGRRRGRVTARKRA